MSTITEPLSDIFKLSDCIEYVGNPTPEDSDFTYKLIWNVCIDGIDVWQEEGKLPEGSGANIPITISGILSCLDRFKTRCPELSDTLFYDENAKVEVVIKYGHIKTSKEGCESVVEITDQTSPITVIYSNCQFYEEEDLTGIYLMNDLPEVKKVCADQCDWITLCSIGGDMITLTGVDVDGTVNIQTIFISDGVAVIPSGPKNLEYFTGMNLSYYVFEINGKEYKYKTCNCSCCDEGKMMIAYQQAKGGWTSESFEWCEVQSGVSRTYNEICKASKVSNNNAAYRLFENTRSWEVISLKKEITITESNKCYWKALALSSSFKGNIRCGPQNKLYPILINISNFDYSTGVKEIELTGYYGIDLLTFPRSQ